MVMQQFQTFLPLCLITIWTICILLIVHIQASHNNNNIVNKCLEECNTALGVEKKDDFGIGCDERCKMQECSKGCHKWEKSMEINCRDSCSPDNAQNSSFVVVPVEELYCIMGCHLGGSAFVQRVKDEMGNASGPVLVAESQTNTSVRIKWNVPTMLFNISFFVQWKYHESAQDSWEFFRSQQESCTQNGCQIEGLQPYTKYKFRVGWLVMPNQEGIYSEESVVISTLAYGAPSTAPTITGLSAVDSTRVSISWDPPIFPNGPIFSYVVYLRQPQSAIVQIKDIPEPNQERFYMFSNLMPKTTYTVSVSCRNGVGEGPTASRDVTTLPQPQPLLRNVSNPYLVLGAHRNVIMQSMQEWQMFEEPNVLYRTPSDATTVIDVAVHVDKQRVFFSDSQGSIRTFRMLNGVRISPVLLFSNSTSNCSALSVDWLNNHLYLVQENAIFRANLDGSNLRAVVQDLDATPSDAHVDPFNGFLFWAVPGVGIYKVDLSAIDEATIVANASRDAIRMIVKDVDLTAFAVDHRNFRLLLPSSAKNTVFSSSLDGVEINDIRCNIQKPRFQNVISLAIFNGLFYWTNGEEVIREEYHSKVEKYFHNTLIDLSAEKSFVGLNVLHPDAQPYPVPVNPVDGLQAVFQSNIAKVSWSPPKLIGGSGVGAWQAWNYDLLLQSDQSSSAIHLITSEHNYTVANLSQDCNYAIQVRASSPGGKGPWSELFKGRTLQQGDDDAFPYLLWSGKDGVMQSDVAAESFVPLTRHFSLHRIKVTDMSWYKDLLFLNTNENLVYVFNMSERSPPVLLQDVKPAVSVAVDWLAKKLYWSNPRQQVISRANFNGSLQEPLPILTIAKELNIDSMGAGLYWTTAHTVEYCRLNGADRQIYFQADFFSGTQVMGLTLDFDARVLYWTIRSFGGASLYRANMMNLANEGTLSVPSPTGNFEEVGIFQGNTERGPLQYFSHRLYWLYDGKEAMVSDVQGENAARLDTGGLANVSTLLVVDPSLQPTPPGFVEVIPDQVVHEFLRVEGKFDNFNITWEFVQNVNFGKVFYEVKVEDRLSKTSNFNITEHNVIIYAASIDPYSPLTVSIRPFTYWGSSRPTVKMLRTPMSTPSAPLHPRVYVTYGARPLPPTLQIGAEFRWSQPKYPNGIILGYIAKCWTYNDTERIPIATEDIRNPEKPTFYVSGLLPNSTYFFEVLAYTQEGAGPPSEVVEARTDEEKPVPRLLLARGDAVKMADIDTREEAVVATDAAIPLDVAFLSEENAIYWLDQDSSLMKSTLDGSNKTRLHTLSSPGNSLTVDWVSRHLYWTQIDAKKRHGTIWDMDLGSGSDPKVVVQRHTAIGSVEVVPFTSSLIWTDVDDSGVGHLMTSATDGSRIQPFLGSQRRQRRSLETCDCPSDVAVNMAMAVDQSEMPEPTVLWVNANTGHIWSSDVRGCMCQMMVNTSLLNENGIPPTSLTADKGHIYWSNSSLGQVFSFSKRGSGVVDLGPVESLVSQEVEGVRSIAAIGHYLQPYPGEECLMPDDYAHAPRIGNLSSSSVQLFLSPASASDHCENISMASVAYTVRYKSLQENEQLEEDICQLDSSCVQVVTYNLSVLLSNLLPYTRYIISVGASNYYSGDVIVMGPAIIFRTLEGVPSTPRNVEAVALTPKRVEVTWEAPLVIRGPFVRYFVTWKRIISIDERIMPIYAQKEVSNNFSFILEQNLEPGMTYFISVRAYISNGSFFNESSEIQVTMCHNPDDFSMTGATTSSLSLSWTSPLPPCIIHRHSFLYKQVFSENWLQLDEEYRTSPNTTYLIQMYDLAPRTRYNFRILAYYGVSELHAYSWPQDESLVFETEGGRPSPPGAPSVLNINQDVYQVQWGESASNGGKFTSYILEARHGDDSESVWTIVYNGSDPKWVVDGLDANHQYWFRVSAYNEYGFSNFTFSSSDANLVGAALYGGNDSQLGVVLGISLSLIIIISAATIFVFLKVCKKRDNDKKKIEEVLHDLRNADLELATLRDLPRHANFVHQDNALYTVGDVPTDEELAALPHIFREQITLSKFLGSGAFGEVFEGIARDLQGTVGVEGSRVAIKTLRKGATDQEKAEFLKEAQLMSNFKHDHILSLLGICLDNDPNFIILELMEGGDLLSYLRGSRSTPISSSSLAVQDLISICVDVAKGCRYLEDMHFVHRDLAARNCLVSSHDPASRVVKIGDFGLARDIYKNDYYRKEGEGLLPVRWMSPESLVDGVFTSQSDVWAFGVLLWEVMTYGQQPYPARTNLEVLHYVKSGGRLDNPENCPDDLHQLMHECWSYSPSDRPTFKYCYQQLQELRRKSADLAVPCVHNHNYFGRPDTGGIDNPGYNEEDVRVSTEASRDLNDDELCLLPEGVAKSPICKVAASRCSAAEKFSFLRPSSLISSPQRGEIDFNISPGHVRNNGDLQVLLDPDSPLEIPKYLELVYDTDNANYENPIHMNMDSVDEPEVNCQKQISVKPYFGRSASLRSASLRSNVSSWHDSNDQLPTFQRRTICLPTGVEQSNCENSWENVAIFGLQKRCRSECLRANRCVNSSGCSCSPATTSNFSINSGLSALSALSGISSVSSNCMDGSSSQWC